MNHYPRHIGDWRVATWNLTKVQRCIYSDLIDTYYDKEQPIPADGIAEEMGCRTVEEMAALDYVLRRYFKLDNGVYRHERCDEEIAHFHHVVDVAKRAGRASADKRGAARAERKQNGGATPVERPPSAPPTTAQPPKTQDPRPTSLQPAVVGGESAAAPTPPPPAPAPEKVSKPSRKAPKDFKVTPDMAAWAAAECPLLSVADIDRETKQFKDHTFGRAITDWVGAWRNWLRKEQKFREQRRAPAPVAAKTAQRDSFMAAVKGDRNGDIARQHHHSREGALDVESRVVREHEEQPPEPRD